MHHQFDEKKDSEDNQEYDRFRLKAWGSDEVEEMSPEGHQTDVMLMTRLLSEAQSQSEESMFRMALSKQDNEVTMHGSDESKGLHHQLNIHLSPEHSALTSSQRGTSGNSGGNAVVHHRTTCRESSWVSFFQSRRASKRIQKGF